MVRSRKQTVLQEREELMYDHIEWMGRLEKLERHILKSLGMSKDREWEIRVNRNDNVEVVELTK